MKRTHYLLTALVAVLGFACEDTECPPDKVRVGEMCRATKAREGVDASSSPSTGSTRADASSVPSDAAPPIPSTPEDGDAQVGAHEDGSAEAVADSSAGAVTDAMPLKTACEIDSDGDGYAPGGASGCLTDGGSFAPGDCDDARRNVHPDAKEDCSDGLDNDCDGVADEGEPEQCNGIDDDCDATTPDGDQTCGAFACKGGACLTRCSSNGDCSSGLFCADGSCKKDNDGVTCTDSAQCASGWCCPYADCWAPNTCSLSPGKDCVSNLQCASDTCVKTCLFHKSNLNEICDEDSDCSTTPYLQLCVTDRCKLRGGSRCMQDNECAFGTCLAGVCGQKPVSPLDGPCNVKDDCAIPLTCDPALQQCKKTPGGSCTTAAQCLSGFSCVVGSCTMNPG
jgi:hypothetical protein